MTATEQAQRPRKHLPKKRTSVDTDEHQLFDKLVTIDCFAELVSLGRSRIYELIREEGLPTFKLGRSTRVPLREASAWLQKRRRP